MYKIELDNGIEIEAEIEGNHYVTEKEVTEEMISGVRKVTIKNGRYKHVVRYAKISSRKRNDKWYLTINEQTEKEREESIRQRKQGMQNKWIGENYERVSVVLPKGTKDRIKEQGYTINGFISEAVRVMLEAE